MARWTTPGTSGRASTVPTPATRAWDRLVDARPGPRWYLDAAPWVVRGALDRAVGGEGRAHPLPDHDRLVAGDRVGFWLVEEADDLVLVLRAEVRAPGTVRLRVVLRPLGGERTRVVTTVTLEPRGALGTAYLLLDLPAREVVAELAHRRMVRSLG